MSKLNIAKFLMSAFNMVKRGDIKSEQDLIKFAKQQFGDLDSGILGQIKDVFTKGKAAAVTETRTKDMMRGDCLLYTSPSPRDVEESRMPSSA